MTTFLQSFKAQTPDLPACPLLPDADLLPELVATEPEPEPQTDLPYPLPWLLPDDAPVAEQTAPKAHQGSRLLAPEADALRVQPGLAVALDNINKAIILQKIYEWMLHNESVNRNLIDGDHYTYNSAAQWQEKHFPWLAVSTVKRLIQDLEADGYIVSQQPLAHANDFRKWLTIPETTRVLIESLIVENSPAQKNPGGDQKNPRAESFAPGGDQKNPHTTGESQSRRRQSQNRNVPQQQQPNEADVDTEVDDDVVVDETQKPDQESISGEHAIDGEAPAAVKALHRDGANDAPISPSSATPPLSPSAADVLRADLIRFGIVPDAVNRLVQTYTEDDIRYVLRRARDASRLDNPPGFVVSELAKGEAGVLGLRAQEHAPHRPIRPDTSEDLGPLPPAVDDPAWNELTDIYAVSIPQLTQAVCRAAGDRYEIAVEGPSVYIPLNRHYSEIRQRLEQLTGHPVALTLIVDPRLECDPVS